MLRVLKAEFLKLRRAKVVLGTMATVLVFTGFGVWGSSIWDPDKVQTWGEILGTSAMFMAGWWGILIYGLAAAHVFGAEYADGTAGNMLTVPVRREWFMVAKLIVLAVWVLGLALFAVGSHAAAAALIGADGFSWQLLREAALDNLVAAFILYLTLPLTAYIAMLGRGYVAPMLFSTAVMAISWSCGFLGWARWFPWAMPATIAGGLGPPSQFADGLGADSWGILLALFAIGVTAIFAYSNRAGEAV